MTSEKDKGYNPHSHDAVLSRIETTLASVDEKIDDIIETQEDHNTRIDYLDRRHWWIMGAGAALGTVGGTIVAFLPKLLTH